MAAPTTGAMIAAIAGEWAAVDTTYLSWDDTTHKLTSTGFYSYITVHGVSYGLYSSIIGPNVTGAATNYDIGAAISMTNDYSINAGVTDSGYRMGLDIGMTVNQNGFSGTLAAQYGIRIQYGEYSGTGAGTITSAYGIYLTYYESGSATVTNKYSIYSSGAAEMYHSGRVEVGVAPSYKFEIRGEGATNSTYSIVCRNSTPASTFYVTDSGSAYHLLALGIGGTTSASPLRVVGLPSSASGLAAGDLYYYNTGGYKYVCVV